jgi:antibiotic biosynthesis monooxygenase (ABM) superfamily enzyme
MRSICSVFCILAFFFFVFYLTQPQRYDFEINPELMFLCVIGYGLYWLIGRLRINPALWRIINALIILIILLIVIGVPEIREFILGWLANMSDPAETLLVLSILCLIICVLCRTRPVRPRNSSS